MATLTNTKIKDTYDGLLKTNDNGVLGDTSKEITDGLGNGSGIYIGTNGRLGIGTDNPSREIEVTGGGNVYLKVSAQTDSDSAILELANTQNSWTIFNTDTANDNLEFNSSTVTDVLVLEKTGKVGIGTSSPSAKMTIEDVDFARLDLNLSDATGTTIADVRGLVNGTEKWRIGRTASASDDFMINVLDSERMRIDSIGQVGIGTSSPSAKFSVLNAPANSEYASMGSGGTVDRHLKFSGFIANGTNNVGHRLSVRNAIALNVSDNDALYIDRDSNVGIGTNSPEYPIDIKSSTNIARFESTTNGIYNEYKTTLGTLAYVGSGSQTVSGGGTSDFGIQASLGSFIVATGGNTERMRITSGGQLQVGGTAQSFNARIVIHRNSYSIESRSTGTGSEGHFVFQNGNGVVGSIFTSGTSTSYNTSSDHRLKEDWQPMAGALDRVEALKPVNFAWKADGSRVDGFLAHELQEVIPEAVTGEKDATEEYEIPAVLDEEGNVIEEATTGVRDVYQGIDQSKIVPLLVAAIQELRAEIELLKN